MSGDKPISIPSELRRLTTAMMNLGVAELSQTGDILITVGSAKEVIMKLGDAAGAKKFKITDSGDVLMFSVDSDGAVTGVSFVGNLVGNVTGTSITATSGQHLAINGATGKDIKFNLTDAAGARKIIVYDSGEAAVFSIDSDGTVTGVTFVGNLTGDVTGNLTGSVTNNNDATHDYAAGHADWTLSATEKKARKLIVSNADTAANIIGPAENREYVLRNASGQAITIKKSGGTGIAVANGKTAIVAYSDSVADYIRVTADATH